MKEDRVFDQFKFQGLGLFVFLGMSRANKQTGAGRRWSAAIFGSVQSEKRCCVCRNMNRSTEDEEKMGSQKIGSGKLSISDDEASADWRDKMAREAQGRLDRLGVGGVGGRLVPVWDKSGTVHEVNRRQARHGRGEAGGDGNDIITSARDIDIWHRPFQDSHPWPRRSAPRDIAKSRQEAYLLTASTSVPLSARPGGARREAEISSIQPTPAGPATRQSVVREGSPDCLDAPWPFAVTAFTRNPSSTPALTQKLSRLADQAIPKLKTTT